MIYKLIILIVFATNCELTVIILDVPVLVVNKDTLAVRFAIFYVF